MLDMFGDAFDTLKPLSHRAFLGDYGRRLTHAPLVNLLCASSAGTRLACRTEQ
jgi:hypothetical protein